MSVSNIFILLGGVALFLFGMSMMGDGLKKVAGNKLELVLYKMSSTPLKGILLGTGVTAVIQSSSATSVMVVGFVNSGMMKIRQAIGVIMGAIIGTSITGWIICLSDVGSGNSGILSLFSTEVLSAIIAVVGIVLKMFTKKTSNHNLGDILLGFAVLMFGMKIMSGSVSELRTNESFLNLLTNFTNPIVGILFGIAFTAVLQSASASVGIIQALSSTGVITFDIALPIIMGIAIGASVPVLLSAIGASTNGKRTAFTYLFIDTLGATVFGIIFYLINYFVDFSFFNVTMNSFGIAALNTLFRFCIIILLAPFIKLLEKIVVGIVKDKPSEDILNEDFARLDERFLPHPSLAVEQTRMSINSMAQKTREALKTAIGLLAEYNQEGYQEVIDTESEIDKYEDRIGNYLTKITGRELNDIQTKMVCEYLHTVSDFERISDHARNIAEASKEIFDKKINFTEYGAKEIKSLSDAVYGIVCLSFSAFMDNDSENSYMVEPFEEVIDDLCDDYAAHHVLRLQEGKCTFQNGYVFNDLLTDMERVSDHCSNIAIAVLELKSSEVNGHDYTSNIKATKEHNFAQNYEKFKAKYSVDYEG